MGLLSLEEVAAYWDRRHEGDDERSGGDPEFDYATSEIYHAVRLGKLLEIVGDQTSRYEPLFLLDAGCGKGWFSRAFARCGHRVDAIDVSEQAIQHCRGLGGGPRYARSTLSGWRNPWLYDAVLAVDVLVHILDDREWEDSVRNLASLVRMCGRLVLTDWGGDGTRVYGRRQLLRGRSRYLTLARECGMRFDSFQPYNFRRCPLGFYVFTRVR